MSGNAQPLALELPSELVERIAQRAAAIVAEHAPETADAGYLDVSAAAEFLSCPKSRIYSLVSAGRIPHYKDESRTLFDRAELREYVRAGGAVRP